MHGLSPGGGCLPPHTHTAFESGGACAIGAQNGCTRVGGREGPMGVGFRGICDTELYLWRGRGLYP